MQGRRAEVILLCFRIKCILAVFILHGKMYMERAAVTPVKGLRHKCSIIPVIRRNLSCHMHKKKGLVSRVKGRSAFKIDLVL